MRSLFLLLWRNNFTLLFILLWSLCFFLIFSNNNFQQIAFINSTNRAVASVLEVVNYFKEYINLKENNTSLARENANLKSVLPESFYNNQALKVAVSDTVYSQQYTYLTARVVNNSVNRRNNFLTLDKGRMHGVQKDMGVISSSGVVGIIKDVSEHYSTVMSVLHKNTKISARFKNNNYFGSLVWEGDNSRTGTLLEIAKHVKFDKGDTIVSTVYSSVFPEGIMIGTVNDWEIKPGDNFYKINIKLSTNFYNLSHVYIVNNLHKQEQQELENSTSSNNDN